MNHADHRVAVRPALKTAPATLATAPRRIPPDASRLAAFGLHLTLDGLGADKKKLDDMRVVFRFLADLPARVAMRAITTPVLVDYDGGTKPEDRGISGFILIAESHISVHTFPAKQFVTIDVYSCRSFDAPRAVAFAKRTFGIRQTEVHTLERGHGFPRT